MNIQAVIFDLDGTITQPYFDFDAIREEIGIPRNGGPVLEALEQMSPARRKRAEEILHYHEQKAIAESRLNPGAKETIDALRQAGIRVGVLTRNQRDNAVAVARMHNLDFDTILGREDGPAKPDAFGVLHLCERFSIPPRQTMLVGDYLFDLQCARTAGAIAVWLNNNHHNQDFGEHADFSVDNIGEILDIISLRR